MTFGEAIALQPAWVQIWLNILGVGAFIVPLSFLIWRQSRMAGVITLVTVMLAGGAIVWMYSQMGYVRVLGLPHVVVDAKKARRTKIEKNRTGQKRKKKK